jgi:hypothetical protein
MEAKFANSLEEATHRYRTAVHRGPGYIANDGYRYIVGTDEREAFKLARTQHRGLLFTDLQARREGGKWTFCSSQDLQSE